MGVHGRVVIGIVCLGLVAGSAGSARAQEVASSFGELSGKVKGSKTVYVTDDAGRKVKGKLVALSPTSLTVLNGTDRQTFEAGKVLELGTVRRQTGKGALAGLAFGAMGGAVVMLGSCGDCGEYAAPFAMAGAMLFGGIGAGVGAAVGAGRTHEQVLYRAPAAATASRFSVAPIISNRGTGAAFALRF